MAYQIIVNDAGVIETQSLNPNEKFINSESSPIGDKTVLDYWRWAFSDLVVNTGRGILAEYLTAIAVGSEKPVRDSWGSYDIQAPNGTRIEVKSASYVQSWHQKELSKIQFNIRKTLEYFPESSPTDAFGNVKNRWSEVYVFCLLEHKEKADINPLDMGQWKFYVIPTAKLNRDLGKAQSISLSEVKKYSETLTFGQIAKAIEECLQ